jgi:uncharacterized protein DUF2188
MSRIRYEVLPTSQKDRKADGSLKRWTISRDRLRVQTFALKIAAVLSARLQAKQEHKAGHLTQLIIKGRDGRIQDERTYGADPRGSKG